MLIESRSPLLTVEESSMRNLDPQDPKDLGHMWSIFSKTSPALENGKRLENLSWRLWTRETLRCGPSSPRSIPQTKDALSYPSLSSPSDLPQLSRSVDSTSSVDSEFQHVSSDDTDKASVPQTSTQDYIKPAERHLTPVDLQNLVHCIKEKQTLTQPLSLSLQKPESLPTAPSNVPQHNDRPSTPRPVHTESSTSTVATAISPESTSSSNTSVSSTESNHSVVRGFEPGTGITSYTSKSHLAPSPQPILKSSTSSKTAIQKKKSIFQFGSSSAEDESSLRNRMSLSLMSCKDSQSSQRPSCTKKQTSFREEVTVMKRSPQDAAVFDESDEEDTEVSESAIDDDDDAWEDDDVTSEPQSKSEDKQLKFHRVDSKANLTTRRSAITLNLEEQRIRSQFDSNNSRSSPALRRSRTSTPNGPSIPASPEGETGLHMKNSKPTTSKPMDLASPAPQPQPLPLQSPRTQRRAMLAGELSESLRKHMLWERQQKNPLGGAGGLKRAHTSADVKNMSQIPELAETTYKKSESTTIPQRGPRDQEWNYYFNNSAGEYHQMGW